MKRFFKDKEIEILLRVNRTLPDADVPPQFREEEHCGNVNSISDPHDNFLFRFKCVIKERCRNKIRVRDIYHTTLGLENIGNRNRVTLNCFSRVKRLTRA